MAGLVEGLAEATEDSSSFFGGYSYCFVDGDPPNKYICHICTLPARDPHQVTCCYNIYCSVCLQALKVKGQNGFICPTCRQPLEGNYFKDGRADREIRCLEVYCNNRMGKGCPWVGTVTNIESHLNVCPFDFVKCTNGCGAEMKRSKLKTHLADRCPKRIIECQYCQSSGMYMVISSSHHLDTCTHYPVKCTNKDCSLKLPRFEMLLHTEACAKTLVSCEYSSIGCYKRIIWEDLEKHNEESMKDHLLMAVKEVELLRADVKMLKEKAKSMDDSVKSLKTNVNKSVQSLTSKVTMVQNRSKSLQAQVTNLQAKAKKAQEETANLQLVQSQHIKAIESLTANVSAQETENKVHKHVFKLSGFTDKRDLKKAWYSPTFYTSPGGYMMALRVDVSGDASNESFMGCYLCLMAGEYDHALEWPFSGVATIELLNQLEEKNHKTYELVFDDALPESCRERVFGKTSTLGWGFPEFIAHSEFHQKSYGECDGLLGDGQELEVLFHKKTQVIRMKDAERDYITPVNSLFLFSVLYDPTDDLVMARKGYTFESVKDLMIAKPLPRAVHVGKDCPCSIVNSGERGEERFTSSVLRKGQLLIIVGQLSEDRFGRAKTSLQCLAVDKNDGTMTINEVYLKEKCEGHFSTQESLLLFPLSLLLEHLELPITTSVYEKTSQDLHPRFKNKYASIQESSYLLSSFLVSNSRSTAAEPLNSCLGQLIEIYSSMACNFEIAQTNVPRLKQKMNTIYQLLSPKSITAVVHDTGAANRLQDDLLSPLNNDGWMSDIIIPPFVKVKGSIRKKKLPPYLLI